MERISLPCVFLKDQASGSSDTLSSVVLCHGQPDILTTGGFLFFFFKFYFSLSFFFFFFSKRKFMSHNTAFFKMVKIILFVSHGLE